jgi:hypothetical protein
MQQPRTKLGTIALTGFAMAAFAANSVLCRVALFQAAIDPATFTLVRLASGTCVLCVILSLNCSSAAFSISSRLKVLCLVMVGLVEGLCENQTTKNNYYRSAAAWPSAMFGDGRKTSLKKTVNLIGPIAYT